VTDGSPLEVASDDDVNRDLHPRDELGLNNDAAGPPDLDTSCG
jgi:hypothetical protein